MSDQGNHGNGRDDQDTHGASKTDKPYHKPSGAAPSGERRYGKPAGAPAQGERRSYSRPAGAPPSGDRRPYNRSGNTSTSGERRPFSRPAGAPPSGEQRYGKPAGASFSGERKPFSRPAGAPPSGERRPFSRPAGASPSGERRPFSRPAGASPSGERRPFSRPAGASPSGERRPFSRPAGASPSGERRPFSRPAGASPSGEQRYGKPAGASFSGERKPFSRPAGAPPSGEQRYGKPAGASFSGERRPFSRPAGAPPSGERRPFSRPAGAPPSGEQRYGKPAGASFSGDRRPFSRPAGAPPSGERRPFSRPAGAPPSGERKPFSRPAGVNSFSRTGSAQPGRAFPANRSFSPRPQGAVRATPETAPEQTGLTTGARRVALEALRDVHEHGAYASLALQDRLNRAKLSPADRRLTTSIVYSTLEQQIQIDFALDRLMEHPTTDIVQRDILRLSACQILFHDRIPDSAAVNEGVNLARLLGMEGTSGFLNGVLRNLVRSKDEIPWPNHDEDLREYLHIMGSTPLWLVDKLIAVYGSELAEKIIMYRSQAHEMVLRPNMMKFSDDEFEALLSGKAWPWRRGLAPHAYLISGASEIALDNDYRSGNFSIQGQSSIMAAEAMQVKVGMRVLDACAAPGGKSCYMAEAMQNTGRVYAWELHEKRALLLESAQRRLKLENLRISIRDAAEPKPDFNGLMDAVLLDAPCSGLGVLTEKPDLKYRLKESDIASIAQSQRTLLNTLCDYVRPGGTLVYSTCSILPEENTEQIKTFLETHPEFSIAGSPLSYPESVRAMDSPLGLQLFAHRDNVEGFFIARLRKARA